MALKFSWTVTTQWLPHHTEWFMTCGQCWKSRFPRSLLSKKLISIRVLFPNVMELWVNFNCHKSPSVNRASQVALRDLEPDGTGSQRKLQLAIRAVHKRAAAWLAPGGGIFESLLKAQANVNWKQFHEVNLYFNLFTIMLVYCFVSFIWIILTFLSTFQTAIIL